MNEWKQLSSFSVSKGEWKVDKTVSFLSKHRYHKNANATFRMSQEDYSEIDFESKKWIRRLEKFVNRHITEQLPRLQELKRYYLADNNIKYRPAKTDEFAADNRIASDFSRYITIFEQGYMLVEQPSVAQTHVVQYGDNLSSIATKLGTTYQALAQRNGLSNPNLIYPGQTLSY